MLRIDGEGGVVKDSKGHGSEAKGGAKVAQSAHAAHQSGVMDAIGHYGPWVAKNAAKIYLAQAAAGAAAGFAYPFLKVAGIVP